MGFWSPQRRRAGRNGKSIFFGQLYLVCSGLYHEAGIRYAQVYKTTFFYDTHLISLSLSLSLLEFDPRALSTRILANAWAFFTLIMTSSYTASLGNI